MGRARQKRDEVAVLSDTDEVELEQLGQSRSASAAWAASLRSEIKSITKTKALSQKADSFVKEPICVQKGRGRRYGRQFKIPHPRAVLTSKFAQLGARWRFRQACSGLFLPVRQAEPASAANR